MDCAEFSSDFLNTMVNVFEVIFASLFLEKIFLELNPVGIKFATTVALQAINKLAQIQQSMTVNQNGFSTLLLTWCRVATNHFEILAYYALFQQNFLMSKNIIEKTKDVETIYVENSLIASKVIFLILIFSNF
jgi:hypothetical protein